MKIEKVTGNRDHMDVHFEDGRVARFLGEMIVGGFVAFVDSLETWDDGTPITVEEKKEILDAVKERQKISKMKVILE